jgi:Domain of Unknown Function with PDB structure (DUF3857)
MKTLYSTLFFLLAIFLQLSAQKGQPGFGKVDKADLEMKDCDFDKGADAVVLIDYGNVYYLSIGTTVFERRKRIKILKEKGISQANVEIPFYNNYNGEKILKIAGNTYNADASGNIAVTEVKKSSIYTKKIYGNYSKIFIPFPEVKTGSIIEYTCTIQRETGSLPNWYFQGSIPVRYSEYQLKIPQIFRFSAQPMIIDPFEEKHGVTDENIETFGGVQSMTCLKSDYIMHNLPGIKDEPYMGSAKDYMQRIDFKMMQVRFNEMNVIDLNVKWEDVIKRSLTNDEDFGKQLLATVKEAKPMLDQAKQITGAEAKMNFIYNQIRKTITWNGDERYVYTDNGIIKTWETKAGNIADINLLLINLLNEAGIKTVPVLFSTRDNGLAIPKYPSVDQFNTVMAYVVLGDKIFVLDATDKTINYKLIPEKVVNTSGFLVEGENGRWKDIVAGKSKYKVMAAVQGEIDEAGVMKGNGLVNCYDYARAQRAKEWISDKQKFKDDYFIKPYPGLQIEDISVNNLDADSLPLEQKVKFSSQLNSSGEYRYFSFNLFSDLEKNPFIADKRVSDVDFGVQQDYIIFGNYTIPPGFVFDGVPENISMTTPENDIVFNRIIQVESNLLNVRMTIEFKKPFYTADAYPEFKEFYKKLFDKLNEQVVIKKKTAP